MLPPPPKALRERKPTKQSVKLGGHTINLTALAEHLGVDHGYLSRILCGKRVPSLPYIKKVANALGWTVDQLLDAIVERL